MTHSNLTVEVRGTQSWSSYEAPVSEQNIGNKTLLGSLLRSTGRMIPTP